MRPFLLFRGSRLGLFYDVSVGESCPPRLSGSQWRAGLPPPHSLRQAQGCGFPHTQVVKRTAASDSAAFDKPFGLSLSAMSLSAMSSKPNGSRPNGSGRKLRPRASRGELVAGRQSQQKRPHAPPTPFLVMSNVNNNMQSLV